MSSDQNKKQAEEFKTGKIKRKKNRKERKGERAELRVIARMINNGEAIDE